MTTSQHIATARILSKLTAIPILSIIIGFISHIILDSIEPQEYKINVFKPDKDILVIEVFVSLILLISARNYYIIIGALLPDITDGILTLINRDRYYSGEHLFWFHKSNNQKTMSKKMTIMLSILLLIVVII